VKSRKLGLFGKKHQRNSMLRKGIVETLEQRQLMANDISPWSDGKFYTLQGWLAGDAPNGVSSQEYLNRIRATNPGLATLTMGAGEDAYSGRAVSVTETENNNAINTANFIPLGTANSKVPIVNVSASLGAQVILPRVGLNPDVDYFAADLRGGDIIDVRVEGVVPLVTFDVTILDASGNEIGGSRTAESIIGSTLFTSYPPTSPLSIDGNTSFAVVIPSDGRYYVRVSDGYETYQMALKAYRPTLEKQAIGTVQKVFVDFNGATLNLATFGSSAPFIGTTRLSPLTNYFAQAGLQPQDEVTFIRTFMAYLQENFDDLAFTGGNGRRSLDGINGHFDIEFLNSLDHPDPGSAANVTRLIISGDSSQLGNLAVRGISNSVDAGNFETSGTVVVLPDVYLNPASGDFVGAIPRAGNRTLLDIAAKGMAQTAAHELGHSFGAYHQDSLNFNVTLMDTGGLPLGQSRIGVGVDGVYGTQDDFDIDFGIDVYDPFQGNIGTENVPALLAFSLSTGTVGGAITGTVFKDNNANRVKDASEPGLAGIRVYTDLNNNGAFDTGEYFGLSNASGVYSIGAPAGSYTVREVVPAGFRLTTPVAGFSSVTIVGTNTVSNVNFGQEQLSLSATGIKWNDVNGNGLRDTGEAGLAGVRIYIDLDGDGRIDIGEPSAKTDSSGAYSVVFPGPGAFRVREVVEPGYVQTFPSAANNFEHIVTLVGNPAVDALATAGLNFGNKLTVDFGDAPVSYGDASAGFTPGLLLGANWDDEQSSQYSIAANGDDIAGVLDALDVVVDDEDGVIFSRPLVAGSSTNRVSISAINTTGVSAYFSGWIDFTQDGDFNDVGEKVLSNAVVGTGTTQLTFAAPAGAVLGSTIARFRYSNERDVLSTGRSLTGEVEDYRITVVGTLELAVDDVATVARNSVINSIDVLANDFALPGEQLSIVTTSGSRAGAVIQVGTNNQILYTPPAGFIGQDTFTYTMTNSSGETDTATVTVNVNLFFTDPQAVDDSFDVALNVIDAPLNVLANDIEGQAGALTIIGITQPSNGGTISIASGGKSLRYTPLRNFRGTETFTYTVADASGKQTTAKGTLHTLPYQDANTDVVFSVRTTDLNGNEISSIQQGRDFRLQVFIDDFRNDRGTTPIDPGVYAAYMDILYDLQIVSTTTPGAGSSLNFDAQFFNNYVSFPTGDASIPGLINEFGAFNNIQPGNQLNLPGPVQFASITFTASSPGIAKFSTDPADNTPFSDTLLFDLSNTAVPIERIRYLSTTIEVVGDSAEFPLAIDDSLSTAIPSGSVRFPINVIANDLPGSTGVINVVATTNGANGTTAIDSQGRVVYTPNGGFTGTDQFEYTIQDTRQIRSRAKVTVRVGNVDANDTVALRLDVTDLNGTPISDIAVGGQFQLRGYVQDVRGAGTNRGVFAAYEDVLYSSRLVAPITSTSNPLGFQVTFGPNYPVLTSGSAATAGIINEIGAVQRTSNDGSAAPLGSAEQLLFIVTMTAKATGQATFVADPADISPLHDTLTFEPASPVGIDFIRFGSDTLNITTSGALGGGEFTNPRNRHDVNNDSVVSPLDALLIITQLSGSTLTASGEDPANKLFVDVNGDNSLSPIDVLLVISYLTRNYNGGGEGESSSPTPAIDSNDSTDSVFASDLDDDVLGQLAFDVESTRKKKS
jgi:large repetitive protein